MLVFSRKENEVVVICSNDQMIRVRVLAIEGKKVRLGVTAADEISVDREELWNRKAEFAEKPNLLSEAQETKNRFELQG